MSNAGKLSPKHIPVVPYEKFKKSPPDVAFLFANHAKEIFDKEQFFKKNGGEWLTHVPTVGFIKISYSQIPIDSLWHIKLILKMLY